MSALQPISKNCEGNCDHLTLCEKCALLMRKKSYYKYVLCGTVTADTHCFEKKRNVRYGVPERAIRGEETAEEPIHAKASVIAMI